jgi:hypothetical protein
MHRYYLSYANIFFHIKIFGKITENRGIGGFFFFKYLVKSLSYIELLHL